MKNRFKLSIKSLVVTSLLVATATTCYSQVDNGLAEVHSDKHNELILSHHFDKSIAFSAMAFQAQLNFLDSFQYNEVGEVISFHLDQESNNLSDNQFSELICLTVKSDVIQLIDEATKRNIRYNTGPSVNPGTGNPPLTYKNKRNNNVGGCDYHKGSICVIRW